MDSSLRERFARLAQTQALTDVPSGLPAVVTLRPDRTANGTLPIPAITALVRRGVALLKAKRVVEECVAAGRALVHIPKVEDKATLSAELAQAGLSVRFIHTSEIDVKAIRERLGFTQEQFALRYGLDLNSLQNWETRRRKPDAAVRSYLKVIDRLPDAVSDALEDAPPDRMTVS